MKFDSVIKGLESEDVVIEGFAAVVAVMDKAVRRTKGKSGLGIAPIALTIVRLVAVQT